MPEKIDWVHHTVQARKLGLTYTQYAKNYGLNPASFNAGRSKNFLAIQRALKQATPLEQARITIQLPGCKPKTYLYPLEPIE